MSVFLTVSCCGNAIIVISFSKVSRCVCLGGVGMSEVYMLRVWVKKHLLVECQFFIGVV